MEEYAYRIMKESWKCLSNPQFRNFVLILGGTVATLFLVMAADSDNGLFSGLTLLEKWWVGGLFVGWFMSSASLIAGYMVVRWMDMRGREEARESRIQSEKRLRELE